MNKQQLIKNLGYVRYSDTDDERYNYYNKGIDTAISFAKKLDEPEKSIVPQFVAEWIEKCRTLKFELCEAMYINGYDEKSGWIEDNSETFAKAWLFGYEVEKEKLYLASFRDTDQYLGWNEKLGEWFMSCSPFTDGVEQTQETWEGVEIWDNPAFEIKEVEE